MNGRPATASTTQPDLRHRPEPLHRLRGLRAGLRGVRHAPRPVAHPPRAHRPGREHPDRTDGLHALRGPDVRAGLPGRCHQADRGGHRAVGAQAPLHRLLELRDRLPVRRTEVRRRVRPDDEVRHVHRPHLGGLRAHVRIGVPERSPLVRHPRGVPRHPQRLASSTTGSSAARAVHTKVFTVVDDLAAGHSTRSTAPPAPGSTTRSAWRTDGRRPEPPNPPGSATSPTKPPPRRTSPAASSPATSSPAPASMAAGNLGLAAWTQLRTINTGEPRELIPLDDVAVGDTYLFRYPDRRRPGHPAAHRRPRGRGVQPEVHPPRLRRLLRGRGGPLALPLPRRQLRSHAPARSSPGPPPRPLGRIEVEIRDDTIWALGYQP